MNDWSQPRISALGCCVYQCSRKTLVGMRGSDQQEAFTEILKLTCFPTAENDYLDLRDPRLEGKRRQIKPTKVQTPQEFSSKEDFTFLVLVMASWTRVKDRVWHRAERRNEHLTTGTKDKGQGTTLGATTYITSRKPHIISHVGNTPWNKLYLLN